MSDTYEVLAIRYAERNGRTRADSFLFEDDHDAPHEMDYFIWLIRNARRTILVDSGYDSSEASARGRPVLIEPGRALAGIGVEPDKIDTLIVTHLHYDHAGGLAQFPNAHLHMQSAEMAFATGPCMCHPVLRNPYSASHVSEAVKRVYVGRMTFHDGDGTVAPGVTVHRIGGHSRGLQCVRVETETGPLVLASDAAHYYENYEAGRLFPIVVDVPDMIAGFDRLRSLAGPRKLIIPGHDPLVRSRFPVTYDGSPADVRRLEAGPSRA